MKLISHRGNLTGKNSCLENHPASILKALSLGYDCEIDVWRIGDKLYLGHDIPKQEIGYDFLCDERLWIHCKNYESLAYLSNRVPANVFFHNNDDYTLTSKGIIWAYPGKDAGENCVRVQLSVEPYPGNIYGVCSDCVEMY